MTEKDLKTMALEAIGRSKSIDAKVSFTNGYLKGLSDAHGIVEATQRQLWEIGSKESEACRWLERAIRDAVFNHKTAIDKVFPNQQSKL